MVLDNLAPDSHIRHMGTDVPYLNSVKTIDDVTRSVATRISSLQKSCDQHKR